MSDTIYVIQSGEAHELRAAKYAKEEDFQELLERFPLLLSGELLDPDSPRRWLLIGREIGIPDGSAASDRWSVDHLFVDQDATPTLVEVKRQDDTRLRREVVGQMLDYAANAAKYWPVDRVREEFAKTCAAKSQEPADVLQRFLEGSDVSSDDFWSTVASRLTTGDMRLIFFADRIGPELQRIVEFLNNQMQMTEVLALEVRRYVGSGLETHIPRVMGLTTSADIAKAAKPSRRRIWTEAEFVDATASLPVDVSAAVINGLALAKETGWHYRFGTGTTAGSLNISRPSISSKTIVSLWTNGALSVPFGSLHSKDGKKPARGELRAKLLDVWRELFGLTPPTDLDSYYPTANADVWTQRASEFYQRLRQIVNDLESRSDVAIP